MKAKEMKRMYERPAMQVVELRQQCHIMAGSQTSNTGKMNVVYEEEDL